MRILLLFALLLLLTGCVGAPNPQKIAADNEVHLKKAGIAKLSQGDIAPAFTASTADGARVTIGVEPLVEPTDADAKATPPSLVAAEADQDVAQTAGEDGEQADAVTEDKPVGDETSDSEPSTGTYTVLYFYPANFTPNSTKHLRDLSRGLGQFELADIKVYGISVGTAEEHRRYAQGSGITVPLLVDTGAVARLYGALVDDGRHAQRTLVGIRPDGTIGFYDRAIAHLPLVNTVLKKTGRAGKGEEKPKD